MLANYCTSYFIANLVVSKGKFDTLKHFKIFIVISISGSKTETEHKVI